MTVARPERTHALVVGVERYAAGAAWDLPGPAADARRFTAWLRGRGVPAAQISLLLEPLPGAGGPEVDVPAGPAGREAVQEVLTRRLPAREGDLLWVFWGGHGVTDPRGHRRLFYADAGPDDRRNLDLDAWLTAFTTDLVPGFARQIWLVDSCQTFVEDLGFARTLPAEVPPGGDRLPGREQFALLASGPGQRAANDPAAQTGAFSRAVLEGLAGSDGAAWPPDMAALADGVVGAFTGGGQRPTSLRYQTWAGDVRRYEAPAPPASPAPPSPAVPAAPPAASAVRTAVRAVPDAAVRALVDLLASWPSMTDQNHRQLVLGMLPVDLAGAVPRLPAARTDILSIVRTCRHHPGGLTALVEAVSFLEPGSLEQGALAEWAARWLPPEEAEQGGAPA
ncbi:effector-associated domain 2-containing protein [Streptomyces termitum]|uniref:effector-associated domain 2-containing protein n=1 Tax=Streptomyces termitum TaxID=67368 RepID=UPI0033BE72E3